ncbi:MAG TPA: T9SS type A sorting domain-containing protein [Chitinophagales bacterium]|nr:T9SS type A sorting domain-containing protein [Chitinophagales bacterium]
MQKIFDFVFVLLLPFTCLSQQWSAVGTGCNDLARTMCVWNDHLIVGGSFISAGGLPVNLVAEWDGTNWSALGNGITNQTTILNLINFNGTLYAAGVEDLDVWDGSNWNSVPGNPHTDFYGFTIFNNKIYFAMPGAVWQFDGTTWTNIGTANTNIYSITHYKGDIYAGGDFTSINSIPLSNIAKWDGSTWSSLGYGILSGQLVDAVETYDNELYVSGLFTASAGNASDYLMKWDGSNWLSIGTGAYTRPWELDSIYGKLYIGSGTLGGVNGLAVNGIASFDGTNWDSLGSGIISGAGIGIDKMIGFDNCVYASGQFSIAGGSIALNIARYCDFTGIETISDQFSLSPNPVENFLNIDLQSQPDNVSLFIYDAVGRRVFLPIEQNHQKISLNAENLPDGLYFIKIKNRNTSIEKISKFIKVHSL